MLKPEPKIFRSDMINCALCIDAPCDQGCDIVDPSTLLRSIWFKNEQTAAQKLPNENPCLKCAAPVKTNV